MSPFFALKAADEQNNKALHRANELDANSRVHLQKLETAKQEKLQIEQEKVLLVGKLKAAEEQINNLDKIVSQKVVVRESFGDF